MKRVFTAIAVAALFIGLSGCSGSADKPDADGKKGKSGDSGSGDKPDAGHPAEGSGD